MIYIFFVIGNLKLFIWCVTPTSDDEFKEIYTSCEVLLEVKIPARGPMSKSLIKLYPFIKS